MQGEEFNSEFYRKIYVITVESFIFTVMDLHNNIRRDSDRCPPNYAELRNFCNFISKMCLLNKYIILFQKPLIFQGTELCASSAPTRIGECLKKRLPSRRESQTLWSTDRWKWDWKRRGGTDWWRRTDWYYGYIQDINEFWLNLSQNTLPAIHHPPIHIISCFFI